MTPAEASWSPHPSGNVSTRSAALLTVSVAKLLAGGQAPAGVSAGAVPTDDVSVSSNA